MRYELIAIVVLLIVSIHSFCSYIKDIRRDKFLTIKTKGTKNKKQGVKKIITGIYIGTVSLLIPYTLLHILTQ